MRPGCVGDGFVGPEVVVGFRVDVVVVGGGVP